MIKTIIFDIGGVLVTDVWEPLFTDPVFGISVKYNIPKDTAYEVGRKLWDEFSILSSNYSWESMEKEYWKKASNLLSIPNDIYYFIELTEKLIKPVSGMEELLKSLQNKTQLAICSNNTEFWFQRQARKLDFFKYVPEKNIILSNRVGDSKSSNSFSMFSKVEKIIGVERNKCLFIDDREKNIKSAVRYGFPAIHFPNNFDEGSVYLNLIFKMLGVYNYGF